MTTSRIAFFGTSEFSVIVLEELFSQGIIPSLIITTPDKPKGRKLILTPSPIKVWAQKHALPTLEPHKLDDTFIDTLSKESWDVFIVASYGKILPEHILTLPQHRTLNIHPSLLPKLRGPSPIQNAILTDMKDTGVSIMELDAEMDHGPIVAQETVHFNTWPSYSEVERILATKGAALLARILPDWLSGVITPTPQEHEKATYTKKFEKDDGRIDLSDDPYRNFRKIQALSHSPGTFFFVEKDGIPIRVRIIKAVFENNTLSIERVVPEGKKEMSFEAFKRGYAI